MSWLGEDSEWDWTEMAGVDLDVSVHFVESSLLAGSDDQSFVSDLWSSALSGVWDTSGNDVSVFGGSLVAGVAIEDIHWSGHSDLCFLKVKVIIN